MLEWLFDRTKNFLLVSYNRVRGNNLLNMVPFLTDRRHDEEERSFVAQDRFEVGRRRYGTSQARYLKAGRLILFFIIGSVHVTQN